MGMLTMTKQIKLFHTLEMNIDGFKVKRWILDLKMHVCQNSLTLDCCVYQMILILRKTST